MQGSGGSGWLRPPGTERGAVGNSAEGTAWVQASGALNASLGV